MTVNKKTELQKLLKKLEGGGAGGGSSMETGNDREERSACCNIKLRWIQIVYRLLVNVDALNMVESVGNVTRRRTVPVIVPRAPGQYVVRWVPAVSGESLAHRYQMEIVELAKTKYTECSSRIDYWSEQGELLKHWDLGFYQKQCQQAEQGKAPKPRGWECDLANRYAGRREGFSLSDLQDIEKRIVDNSLVEDIGGFLVTQGPTRRTSCIRFSYLIPTLDAIEATQLDHQMHVRGALKAQSLRLPGYEEAIQVPYYVQVGSVLYGGNIELDLCCVGSYSIAGGCVEDKECTLTLRRCVALDALRPLLEGDFGAKRSRYRPHNVTELVIAVLSDRPVPLPPATLPLENLVEELKRKLDDYKKLNVDVKLVAYVTAALGSNYAERLRQLIGRLPGVEITNTIPDLIGRIRDNVGLQCTAR
ncbi:CRISPR-associated autoregulator, DevR family [Pyrolobus fumarii 1A]|uniref:CRISPR-associated autoregulator, DevR family n=1 Tax=Pyrolobus fumarii (strain DSM 11204 / 1A) TaxID=694429 RepID=G0EGK6_PYRF1|nr:DevR family CRISPR-associated autoregulator [Pyrolobus fumarii]AEM38380.1 CRISPR-associated autoregulator, DevR family [Pyrolobus fumarii 1A]